MATFTTNFGWTKPGVNDPVDRDQWGYQLNNNYDSQDDLIFKLSITGKGATRPSYAKPGTLWIDDTSTVWILYVYDGTTDIPLGSIDSINNQFNPSNGTLLTNQGDLLTCNGSAQTVLPVGSNGQVLTVDSTAPNGIKWGAGGGGGGSWTTIIRTSSFAFNTSTLDPVLQFSMAANTNYIIELFAVCGYGWNGAGASFITGVMAGPSSPISVIGSGLQYFPASSPFTGDAGGSGFNNAYPSVVSGGAHGNSSTVMEMKVVVFNGANSGNLNVTWGLSNTTTGTIFKGSYLRYTTF